MAIALHGCLATASLIGLSGGRPKNDNPFLSELSVQADSGLHEAILPIGIGSRVLVVLIKQVVEAE